ncbi:MAG: hypothetical protein U1C97_01625, partial [Candidatus Gracilibacteria bacterium]|nr:hypothetical protein [Candidatus Gracilibacteria bacterium]
MYIISLLLPFIALFFLVSSGVLDNVQVVDQLWLAYGLYGLILTVYFFVKCVNFELGGVVITTQRVLCFGYIGLFQVVERDILPNKLEDVQILKRGFLSMFFDAADVHIHTSTGETEELDSVIDSKRIQSLLAELFRNATRPPEKSEKSDKVEKKKEG